VVSLNSIRTHFNGPFQQVDTPRQLIHPTYLGYYITGSYCSTPTV